MNLAAQLSGSGQVPDEKDYIEDMDMSPPISDTAQQSLAQLIPVSPGSVAKVLSNLEHMPPLQNFLQVNYLHYFIL